MVTASTDLPATAPARQDNSWQQALDSDESHCHLTTVQGWRRFTTDRPTISELLPRKEWARRGGHDRLPYDEARLDYHTRLSVVATPTIRQVVHADRRLTLLNRHAISTRRGLILSGAAGTGKTTAITQFGKIHEVIDCQRQPRYHRSDSGGLPRWSMILVRQRDPDHALHGIMRQARFRA